MTDEVMIRVVLPEPPACFGLVASRATGRVIDAAPIARYTIGWVASRAVRYFTDRGADITWGRG